MEEVQLAGVECATQLRDEQTPKQSRQHTHRQEEAGPAGDPTLAIRRDAAARYHAVQVRVMQQVLTPGVQDRDEADLGAQVLGVRCNRAQRLGGGAEQDVVDGCLVLIRDRGDLLRRGEDDMEVFDRQQFAASIVEPFGTRERLALRAVPVPAAVERDALMATGVALLDMTAERSRATTLDRSHHTALPTAQVRRVITTIGRADLAEDVRHFEPERAQRAPSEMHRRTRAGRRLDLGQQIQRAGCGAHGGGRNLQVA